MRKFFYAKLALINLKKNKRAYVPYLLTCIGTTMMYYIMLALSKNSGLSQMAGGTALMSIMNLGTTVIGIFSFIFLFYTNSFLIKQRKKEFGLYNILGLEKKHISKVLGYETLFLFLATMVLGLAGGILFSKLVFLLVLKLLHFEVVFGFEISLSALASTAILFAAIFLVLYLNNLRQIHLAKPVELLRANAGEKEPKTKWLLAIFGLLCLGGGYGISVGVKDPLSALSLFFLAVILVIIGTYSLFTAGSIALLKMLRRRRSYYYKTNHFISVSGMIYRMKQNAAGLASICILSTAVLVMLSSTGSLYAGMQDVLTTRYPRNILITNHDSTSSLQSGEMRHLADETAARLGIAIENKAGYTYLSFAAAQFDDTFSTDSSLGISAYDKLRELYFLTEDEYTALTGRQTSLQEGEILIYPNRMDYPYDTVNLFDFSFRVKEVLKEFDECSLSAMNIASSYYIIVPDEAALSRIDAAQREAYGDDASNIESFYGFDLANHGPQAEISLYEALNAAFSQTGWDGFIESREANRNDFYGTYGGLFFLGIFLGLLFLMATVLIIYYKQISEGYDDQARFEIMQKVGLSRAQIKRAIHSQVLTVFFLPLITAGVHICFAFPVIARLLPLLNLHNTPLFALSTLICFLIFAVFYAIVYVLTARSYYKIVNQGGQAERM